MKLYAIYDSRTYKILHITRLRNEAIAVASNNDNAFYRDYKFLTKKQITVLPYAKAVDFESTLKECA